MFKADTLYKAYWQKTPNVAYGATTKKVYLSPHVFSRYSPNVTIIHVIQISWCFGGSYDAPPSS